MTRFLLGAVLTLGPLIGSASTAAPLRFPPHRTCSCATRSIAVHRPALSPTAATPLRIHGKG